MLSPLSHESEEAGGDGVDAQDGRGAGREAGVQSAGELHVALPRGGLEQRLQLGTTGGSRWCRHPDRAEASGRGGAVTPLGSLR